MPVDSFSKRASCIGIDLMWCHVYAKPDGTIDVNDRQQIGMKYAGTLALATGVTATYRCLLGVGI